MSLLEVRDLTVRFGDTTVVDRVSFDLDTRQRLGIIGESGSGKTLTALSVIGLLPDSAVATGSVRFRGAELLGLSDRELSRLRGGHIATVFQNPLTSLNPVSRVGHQIAESVRLHTGLRKKAALAAAVQWCARVGLPDPDRTARAYPHQLSGGQRQRVGIAIALAGNPQLLIADEPTTALDVTVQADVLRLLDALVEEEGTALLFITHDIELVTQVVHSLLVMRRGEVVDRGDVAHLIEGSTHPYTEELIEAARRTSLPFEQGAA